MTDAHLAVICNRTGDAERLQPFTEGFRNIGSRLLSFFYGCGCADQISPSGIFK